MCDSTLSYGHTEHVLSTGRWWGEEENSSCFILSDPETFLKRIGFVYGGCWNDLLRETWSEIPEFLPGIEPRNPWLKGRTASRYAAEESNVRYLLNFIRYLLLLDELDFVPWKRALKKRLEIFHSSFEIVYFLVKKTTYLCISQNLWTPLPFNVTFGGGGQDLTVPQKHGSYLGLLRSHKFSFRLMCWFFI